MDDEIYIQKMKFRQICLEKEELESRINILEKILIDFNEQLKYKNESIKELKKK